MKKLFSKFITVTLILVSPILCFAEISRIAFTSEEQTIKPGEISGPITVQAQDSNGTPHETTETLDLEFTSTSNTGEFLGASGGATTKTMNKNTANRTFYYRDTNPGSFIIKVIAKGRESGKEWNVSQQVTVSSSAASQSAKSGGSNSETTSSVSNPSNQTLSTTNQNSSDATFEVSAGGDRLTAVGSPISFEAKIKKSPSMGAKVNYFWVFGDGAASGGQSISHTYKHPGIYAVVLTASLGSNKSTSRLKVEVVKPEVEMIVGDGTVEIKNNSEKEINLFNWKLKSINFNKEFIFQPNTIILPESAITFDDSVLNLGIQKSVKLKLEDALGKEVVIGDGFSQNLIAIKEEADSIKQKVLSMVDNTKPQNQSEEVSDHVQKEVFEENKAHTSQLAGAAASQIVSGSSTEEVIFEAQKESGFFAKLTDFIKRVLFD